MMIKSKVVDLRKRDREEFMRDYPKTYGLVKDLSHEYEYFSDICLDAMNMLHRHIISDYIDSFELWGLRGWEVGGSGIAGRFLLKPTCATIEREYFKQENGND